MRYILILLIFLGGCASMPEPPTRKIVNTKRAELANFNIRFTEAELDFKRVPDYVSPNYPVLPSGTDGCGKNSSLLIKEDLVQVIEIPILVKDSRNKISMAPISDNKHVYYRSLNKEDIINPDKEQKLSFWRKSYDGEKVNSSFALFTLDDIKACQIGIQLKRTYADLIPQLIERIQREIKLRNLERGKAKLLYASLEKEMGLNTLKKDVTIEILATDLEYAEEMVTYLEKKMDFNSFLFKTSSVIGIIAFGAAAASTGF